MAASGEVRDRLRGGSHDRRQSAATRRATLAVATVIIGPWWPCAPGVEQVEGDGSTRWRWRRPDACVGRFLYAPHTVVTSQAMEQLHGFDNGESVKGYHIEQLGLMKVRV
jgi:hypothetical protein